ncbi:PAS domain-containing protein [Sneathiella marina]|uniref:PAS domain-containing protein n=1 Tax=Sneathiella marina TaxID=2950108 RepID=A0ABY4W0V7_9PROT|nr:PAS domain-containing protein [Sneathiella marina]USG59708.1 PAS domain-containing protein [Sneathiella marina]
MTKYTDVDFDIKSTELADLLRYWREIKEDQTLPLRDQFNPAAVPQCLKYIVLLDVKEQTPTYYIRLAGSAVNPAYLEPISGRYLEHILAQKDLDTILPQYEHTVKFRVPTFMQGSANMPSNIRLSYERLILPASTDGRTVDKLIVGIKFADIKQELLDRPVYKT